jgi:hypothetical protein
VEELDLYPLNVQSPWHGYGSGRLDRPLGDVCASCRDRRLELTGNDTLARQRSAGFHAGKLRGRFDEKPSKPE